MSEGLRAERGTLVERLRRVNKVASFTDRIGDLAFGVVASFVSKIHYRPTTRQAILLASLSAVGGVGLISSQIVTFSASSYVKECEDSKGDPSKVKPSPAAYGVAKAQSGYAGWDYPYMTPGGSSFIAEFQGKTLHLTCEQETVKASERVGPEFSPKIGLSNFAWFNMEEDHFQTLR
ncbi:hypothetical protein HYS97_03625 [Candidatus Daviesbacteria bacterium]|nr:hypothetical protein [Candidatus Daviesbacteria bacterium]